MDQQERAGLHPWHAGATAFDLAARGPLGPHLTIYLTPTAYAGEELCRSAVL